MPLYRDPTDTQLYEVIKTQTCSGKPLEVTTSSGNTVQITPAGTTAGDAFGRLRISQPLTLFDSSHRYLINGNWETLTSSGATVVFNADQGLVDLNVTSASGSRVYRETNKVFPYQPGKSLLSMSTFVFAPGHANRRQRVGYFSSGNGIYLQLSGSTLGFVERSSVSGSITDTVVPQSSWNQDKLDGTGNSGITLDPTKAQIFWMDIEWLGVGTVRTGFVINGEFIHCHSFHHANIFNSTYITTATLPVRYEVENLNTTTSSGTLKQICSTIISEGGYELRGDSRSVGTSVTSPYTFSASGVNYPVASIRLKTIPDRLDAVVIPNALSFIGVGNNAVFNWRIVSSGTVSGGTWATTDSNSAVEYNLSGTSISGGTVLAQGFTSSDTQGKTALEIATKDFLKYQLQRNSFTSTPTQLTFTIAAKGGGDTGYASIDWEEVVK